MSWLHQWDLITMYFKATPEQNQKPKPKSTAEDFRRIIKIVQLRRRKTIIKCVLHLRKLKSQKKVFSKKLMFCIHTRKMLHNELETESRSKRFILKSQLTKTSNQCIRKKLISNHTKDAKTSFEAAVR